MAITSCILPNSGLSNKLFPWASCVVFSEVNSVSMLAPIWWNVKISPWLRGERDKRLYLEQTRGNARCIKFPLGLFYRITSKRINVRSQDIAKKSNLYKRLDFREVNYVFQGEEGHFKHLLPFQPFLKAELLSIASQATLKAVSSELRCLPSIGIHIRRGDFKNASCDEDYRIKGAVRTPLAWYTEIIRQLKTVNSDLEAFVVSDAEDTELLELLSIRGIHRKSTGSALGDLILLSKAKFIIGSGGSSFSAWGSFLGQCPIVAIDGQCFSWFSIPELKSDASLAGLSCFTLPLSNPLREKSSAEKLFKLVNSLSNSKN